MTVRVNHPGLAFVLLWLAVVAGSSSAAAQTRLEAAYTARVWGLPIGHIFWTVELLDNRIVSTATGGITGLLKLLADAHGDVTAHAKMARGKPLASDFTLKLLAGKWFDDVRIVFHGDKAKEYVAAAPANPDAKRVALTDADRIGAVDPMTALLVPIPGRGSTTVAEACDRTVPVFDGHTRYDLRLAFRRFDQVRSDEGYEGPVVVCSVKFLPIAGYDPKHFLITYLAAQRDTEIWLAPFSGTRLMVPYRASMPTPIGLGILQATKFVSSFGRSHTDAK
jgi:hypothetical protein